LASTTELASLLDEVAWLDSQHDAMVALVERLCNLNSGTFNLAGLDQVRALLADEFTSLGGEMAVIDTVPTTTTDAQGHTQSQPLGKILHIVKHPDARPRLLLCIHMDTVYDVDHPFQSCRWLDEQRLNGPGVADAKGGIVVMLYALRALERSRLAGRVGWEVVLNPDEEIGSPGSHEFLAKRAAGCAVGLLFEPTLPDGSMVSWRKGTGNFRFAVHGRAAHAGRDFAAGRNAIVALARLVDAIDRLNSDPDVTYNVGRIEGGGALNIVPDRAVAHVNVRVKTVAQQHAAVAALQAIAQQDLGQDGFAVELSGEFTSPPKPLDNATVDLQRRVDLCGQQLGIPIRWAGSGGASDGNKFHAAGLVNIDSFGPDGGSIHSDQEFLRVDTLVTRTKLAALVLLSFAAPAAG